MLLLAGCGLASNPEPPTLWLPAPVKDLSARRVGNEVHLHWTMPKETTDKVRLKGDQKAHFCLQSEAAAGLGKPNAAFDAKGCEPAGDGEFGPGRPANFSVPLPANLANGSSHAVAYFVELENHAGKAAGPSNAAYVATGTAPAPIAGFRLETRAAGVVVRWDPATSEPGLLMRIHRTLVHPAGAAGTQHPNEANGSAPVEEQTLEVDLDKGDPGDALDRDALLDHIWKYWMERVVRVHAGGHALEIASAPSDTVTVNAKDVFPPAVPSGLVAVADQQSHAIDLSWVPDRETDLAGYFVYRRDVTAGIRPERISGKNPVVPPSLTDSNVLSGHRYAYSVSAVDQDGNESARSGEVEDALPQ